MKILTPDTPSEAQEAQLAAVKICRDLLSGTATMRARGNEYLPRFPLEAADSHAERVKTAVLFNGFARTVSGLTGMVLRKDPTLSEDVPIEISGDETPENEGMWENIDNSGTHGDVFVADRLSDALTDGHVGIFVDMPPKNPDVKTKADQNSAGSRPYWMPIFKADILRWRTIRVGSKMVLTYFAFKEEVIEEDGDYGEKKWKQVREYKNEKGVITFRVLREPPKGQAVGTPWTEISAGEMEIDEIPLSIVYAHRVGVLVSKPPLEDLAYENVGHYQILSDYRNTLHIVGVPFLAFTGGDGSPVKIAPDAGLQLPENATVAYVEPTGNGLSATRQELQDTEGRMSVLGLAMLHKSTRAPETVDSKRMDKGTTDSALSRVARSLQDAIEEALRFTALWIGQKDGGSVTINREFEAQVLDPRLVTELRALVSENRLSLEMMWDILENGGWLPTGFDRDLEKDRIVNEALKNAPLPTLPILKPIA